MTEKKIIVCCFDLCFFFAHMDGIGVVLVALAKGLGKYQLVLVKDRNSHAWDPNPTHTPLDRMAEFLHWEFGRRHRLWQIEDRHVRKVNVADRYFDGGVVVSSSVSGDVEEERNK